MRWLKYKFKRHPISNQLFKEEVLNVVTHISTLLIFSFLSGMLLLKTNYFLPSIIFCIANINMFAASTLYHYFEDTSVKKKFQIFDHAGVNLLIASSYTPFCVFIGNYTILVITWALTILNIATMILKKDVTSKFLLRYLVMG